MNIDMVNRLKARTAKIPRKLLKRSDPILTIKVWANGMYFMDHDALDEAIPHMAVPAIVNTSLLLEMIAETCSQYAKSRKIMDCEDISVALDLAKGVH